MNTLYNPPSPNPVVPLAWLQTDPDFLAKNGFSNQTPEHWKQWATENLGVKIEDEPEARFVGVYYGFSKTHCTDGRYSQNLSSFFSCGFALIQQVANHYGSILGNEEEAHGSHILIQDRKLNTWALWGYLPGVAFLKNSNEPL